MSRPHQERRAAAPLPSASRWRATGPRRNSSALGPDNVTVFGAPVPGWLPARYAAGSATRAQTDFPWAWGAVVQPQVWLSAFTMGSPRWRSANG